MGQHRTHVDFESRSLADLPKVGEHSYAQHWSTAPLMLAYYAPELQAATDVADFMTLGVNSGYAPTAYAKSLYPYMPGGLTRGVPVPIPQPLDEAIRRGDTFVAHNARFEQALWYWICHRMWGWAMPARWSCTAARSRYWGIRASLDGASSDLEVLNRKNEAGKEFINEFCKPRKYKGAKMHGIVKDLWFEPHENPDGWARGLTYCGDDVLAEKDIDDILPDLPEFEQAAWELDFKMNTRGLPMDMVAVRRAKLFSDHFTKKNVDTFEAATALRPTQRDRVLEYLQQREEIETLGDLRSKTVKRLIATDIPADLRELLAIRLETAKASVKKLEAIERCTDSDGRARGLFLYGGAHTMRWSGKRIQPQNFTRGDAPTQAAMFDYLEGGWWERPAGMGHNGGPSLSECPEQPEWAMEAGYRFLRPLGTLAASMRGFIKAPEGHKIVQGDYAQIEARVLAWLARCESLLTSFREGLDPYVSFGARSLYGREYADCFEYRDGVRYVKKDFKHQRQVSKSAVLGAGFGLGKDQFVVYCDNQDIIITPDEADKAIKAYRRAHPEICDYDNGLWARMERGAIWATFEERPAHNPICLGDTGLTFHIHRLDTERYWLVMTFPSGRHMAYYRPKVRLGERFGRTVEKLSFRTEWNGKSYREDTYGGKLTENAVQGIARDIMCIGALNVERAGYPVIGLVHDEVLSLPEEGFGHHDEFVKLMCQLPAWITDLPVEAEGGTMYRYGK